MPLPTNLSLDFKGWVPWDDVFPDGGRSKHMASGKVFTEEDLARSGVYALAHFDTPPPSSASILTHEVEEVFYIGESHGPSMGLRARLTGFGASAGMFGEPARGHYAAWWYPWRFPDRRPFATPEGGMTSARGLYVAVHPCPTWCDEHPDAPGVYPVAVEGLVLWSHVARPNGSLPLLNNKGKGEREPLQAESLPRNAAAVLTDSNQTPGLRSLAANWLVGWMGVQLGAKPWDRWAEGKTKGWTGHAISFGNKARWSIYLGHYTEGAGGTTLAAYDGKTPHFDSTKTMGRDALSSADALDHAWQDLWQKIP